MSLTVEGSAEHKAVCLLTDDFRGALVKFQQQAEATAHVASTGPLLSADEVAAASCINGSAGCGAVCSSSSSGGDGSGGLASSSSCSAVRPLCQQLLGAQQQHSIAINDGLMHEREVGIEHINRSVQDVAEIFQDLALLVNEQGAQIENIQTNIETAADSTTRGVRELARASRSQRRKRSRMCIIAVCVLVILVVLVLVLFFLHKLSR